MSVFRKPQVVVLKEADSAEKQIQELEKLEKKASGDLKTEISKQIRLLKTGSLGEDEIMFQLNYSGMDMFVIRDLHVEIDGLTAQIDYYVVTSRLHFIIECKNLFGNITVNNKGDFIRSYQYKGKTVKEGIESPITQNERHMLVIKNKRVSNTGKIRGAVINKSFNSFTKSLVVLANEKTVLNDRYAPKNIKNKVIRADNLVKTIKEMCANTGQPKCSIKEMEEQARYVLSMNVENNIDYVAKYREAIQEQSPGNNDNICPRCGAELVKRSGKRGEFLGCSRFPKCRYTADLGEQSNITSEKEAESS